jgi:hypothetical protein
VVAVVCHGRGRRAGIWSTFSFGRNGKGSKRAHDTFITVAALLGCMPTIGDPLFTLASALGAGGKGAAHLMQVTIDSVRQKLDRSNDLEKQGASDEEKKKDMV